MALEEQSNFVATLAGKYSMFCKKHWSWAASLGMTLVHPLDLQCNYIRTATKDGNYEAVSGFHALEIIENNIMGPK